MWLYRINRTAGPLIGSYWRLRLAGDLVNIPTNGPLLVASNHSSFLDPWFIGMVFPRRIRYLVADQWYHRNSVWNAVFRAFGTVPVKRGDPRATIRIIEEVLDRGEVVGIFPEGRVSCDGLMQRFHSGVARAAARSGAPVLPLGIRGGFESLPRSRRIPRPTRVTIHVGEILQFADGPISGRASQAEIRKFNEDLEKEIRRLAGKSKHAVMSQTS
jgi:1-acyl-sn-glycerol-3-phosphate acyltransferase